ncbi:MAG: branched-chain amino acid ABC transporter permease [Solirubrobacterales bacterium]|nr:branched-chain amino acid ABC transporter permease [Solirubrobacterales bacterium]MBV9050586.1 branched-chain amino acid ABC transporter permease [Solirubrobacterales bacterium]
MQVFIQTVVNGLTTGCLYALIALGYTMVYGILKLLNFAHGDVYMVGAYIGYFVIQWFGGPTALTIPVPLLLVIMFVLAGGGCGALGVAMERFAYRPLRDAPRIAPLITALGLSFVIENTVLLLFGGFVRSYQTNSFISSSNGIRIGDLHIDTVQILIFVLTGLMCVALKLIVDRTMLGKSMRAVASDREAAEMLGVDVNRTIALTFFIGSAMAGVAGVMSGLAFNQISNTLGFLAGLKAFTAAVVGGIGSIPGAMIGGIFIGLCEAFSQTYVSSQYSDLIVFGILIATMLIRPTGIFSQRTLQKV